MDQKRPASGSAPPDSNAKRIKCEGKEGPSLPPFPVATPSGAKAESFKLESEPELKLESVKKFVPAAPAQTSAPTFKSVPNATPHLKPRVHRRRYGNSITARRDGDIISAHYIKSGSIVRFTVKSKRGRWTWDSEGVEREIFSRLVNAGFPIQPATSYGFLEDNFGSPHEIWTEDDGDTVVRIFLEPVERKESLVVPKPDHYTQTVATAVIQRHAAASVARIPTATTTAAQPAVALAAQPAVASPTSQNAALSPRDKLFQEAEMTARPAQKGLESPESSQKKASTPTGTETEQANRASPLKRQEMKCHTVAMVLLPVCSKTEPVGDETKEVADLKTKHEDVKLSKLLGQVTDDVDVDDREPINDSVRVSGVAEFEPNNQSTDDYDSVVVKREDDDVGMIFLKTRLTDARADASTEPSLGEGA